MIDPRLAELLLHRPPMLLVDEFVSADLLCAQAWVEISESSSFFQPDRGVPSHIGLEYMAQTVGLVAGTISRTRGDGAPLGYLLGTRKYQCNARWFPPGCRLLVNVKEELSDHTLGVYQCDIETPGLSEPIIASARLTVFKAADLESTAS